MDSSSLKSWYGNLYGKRGRTLVLIGISYVYFFRTAKGKKLISIREIKGLSFNLKNISVTSKGFKQNVKSPYFIRLFKRWYGKKYVNRCYNLVEIAKKNVKKKRRLRRRFKKYI